MPNRPSFEQDLAALRSSMFDISLRNRLINLPLDDRARVIKFAGSATRIHEQLVSKRRQLTIGEDELSTWTDPALVLQKLRSILADNMTPMEEQGISSLRLGLHLIRWRDTKDDRDRYAPLWLLPISVTRDGKAYRVNTTDEPIEINETFASKAGLDTEQLRQDPIQYLKSHAGPIVRSVIDDAALGLFSQARLAMSRRADPSIHGDLLSSDILRRLVATTHPGYRAPQARRSINTDWVQRTSPNVHAVPADASQDRAITLSRSGEHLVIQGPPGTGKSQTIANIIVNAVKDGRTVLFMTEKITALEAVSRRLTAPNVRDRILALHGSTLDRDALATKLQTSAQGVLGVSNMLRSADALRSHPVIMTSPAAFALHVPPEWRFDLLIVDEASQMHLAAVAAAIAASNQLIVCGDSQQMGPSLTFQKSLDSVHTNQRPASLLEAAAQSDMPSTMLERHYRSLHPALIYVSNKRFYQSRLSQIPSPFPTAKIGVALHYIEDGVYDRGQTNTNEREAEAVAQEVLRHAQKNPRFSLGVIAMNDSQRDLIEAKVEAVFSESGISPDLLNSKQGEEFFIRSAEHVQGDERDAVLLSLTYAKDAQGHLSANFGSLNQPGGDKRFNVIISRSRFRTSLFASFRSADMRSIRTPGVEVMHYYLWLAERGFPAVEPQAIHTEFTRVLRLNRYQTDLYNDVLCVKDERGTYVGAVYTTGIKHPLDEQAEIAQLKGIGWQVADIPYEHTLAGSSHFDDALDITLRHLSRFHRIA